MNRDDVIDLLTVITAGDHRTVGDSDITFWLEIVGDLQKDLAMQAVRDHFRTKPGVWLEPGHIVARAREIHRDMLDRAPREPIENGADDYYPGDAKAAPDLPDYPTSWDSERRRKVYWYAMSLRAVPKTTGGWQALADQLDDASAGRQPVTW